MGMEGTGSSNKSYGVTMWVGAYGIENVQIQITGFRFANPEVELSRLTNVGFRRWKDWSLERKVC